MDFKIIDVFEWHCNMVLRVEHYNPNGSPWFLEHHTRNGQTGLVLKRAVDAKGWPYLENGQLAPSHIDEIPGGEGPRPFLPSGQRWKYEDVLRLTERKLLYGISQVHKQRLLTGFPQGTIDVLAPMGHTADDELGCARLVDTFKHLIGRQI